MLPRRSSMGWPPASFRTRSSWEPRSPRPARSLKPLAEGMTAIGVTTVEGLEGGEATGDGTTMEEATRPVVFDLREAIRRCRDGRIPDMKTEVGLLRLADRIGYLPQIDRFVHELDPELRAAHDPLGVEDA